MFVKTLTMPSSASSNFIEDNESARLFTGVARLYGLAALRLFEQAKVAVIGIGGVGSWVAEALARNAVGRLTLIDLDHITEGNTNRQIHALQGSYGQAKVAAMAQRIQLINPQCEVTQIDEFVEEGNLASLLSEGFDYVIDAIDQTRIKAQLIAWCVAHEQPLITVGGAGGRFDPLRIRLGDLAQTTQDPLLAKVRAHLRKQHGFARGPKAKFKVPAVFSDEPLTYPSYPSDLPNACQLESEQEDTTTASDQLDMPVNAAAGINCAGFGSSVCVTASFGLAAAAYVLRSIAQPEKN